MYSPSAAPLPTGRYPYELLTFSNYGSAGNSSIGAISRGFTMIRNEQQSAFGAGWTLRGVDRLIPTTGDTLMLAGGDGRTIPFVNTSVANFVSWWPAEGSSADLRSGLNGTLNNGVTFATGQVGQGFNLDGVNDFISVSHNVAHNPLALSIAGWVNITQAPTTGQEYCVLSKYGGNFDGYILRVGSTMIRALLLLLVGVLSGCADCRRAPLVETPLPLDQVRLRLGVGAPPVYTPVRSIDILAKAAA